MFRFAVCFCALSIGSIASAQTIYEPAFRPKFTNPYYSHLSDHAVAQLRALQQGRAQVFITAQSIEGPVVIQSDGRSGCGEAAGYCLSPGVVIANPYQLYFRKSDLVPLISNSPPVAPTTQPVKDDRPTILIIPKRLPEAKPDPKSRAEVSVPAPELAVVDSGSR